MKGIKIRNSSSMHLGFTLLTAAIMTESSIRAKRPVSEDDKQMYLLEQYVVWQRVSVHLGGACDNVRDCAEEQKQSASGQTITGTAEKIRKISLLEPWEA